jgi:hypothetical protein
VRYIQRFVEIHPAREKDMATWIVLGVIAAIAIWLIAAYNGLVSLRQRTNQAFADIDVQLKQRLLFPTLSKRSKATAVTSAKPWKLSLTRAMPP